MPDDIIDVTIVGGGPAGSTAAVYAARFGLRTLVVDKGLTSGALGTSHKIHNYPGIPGPLAGPELLMKMRGQAESFGAEFVTERVIGTDLSSSPLKVFTGTRAYSSRAVILATGSMGRPRGISGETALLGKGVSYCAVCDGAFFRNLNVAVLGGNDEAAEEALLLTAFAETVYLVSPFPKLRASESISEKVSSHPKIRLKLGRTVQEITGKEQVEGIRLSGEGEFIPLQGVFIFLQGSQPIIDYLLGQIGILEDGCIRVDGEMQTNVPGVFAVGDLLCRKIKQAVIAAAEGAVAAIAAEKYLRARGKARLDWR